MHREFLRLVLFKVPSCFGAGLGQGKHCPKVGYCSSQCSKVDEWSFSSDCKYYCCIPPSWKGK
uniref:CYGN protein n=1 Tax=Athene cunicularia TaxID=194338 RepID=A0A663MI28_ATHCN